MSQRLPVVSGREAVAALQRLGLEVLPNRGKGSHIALWRADLQRPVIVPDHKELDRGTLRSILRGAGVSDEEFRRAL
ncbi:MAG: type II toxin-antitoxin system HicA family toxin [Phycisphaerales bacterium JB039]